MVAQRGVCGEGGPDAGDVLTVEAVAFAQFGRATRAVEEEDGFAAGTEDVDVRGPVVVGIEDDAQAIESLPAWSAVAAPD